MINHGHRLLCRLRASWLPFHPEAEGGEHTLNPQFPREVITLLLEAGYIDCYRALHPMTASYTTTGSLRTDYIFAYPLLAKHLYACNIVTGAEAEMASDHFPVWAEFK